ncbi:MAG: hypothetical protein COA79_10275 [Planctomycetota bacterium]|nr:MAG: hypothetical protein COA79_10275 [Planctomycetota bacterium]
MYSFTLFNELSYPLGDFYLSEKGALLNILILSISFFITKTIIKEIRSELFIFLAAIIHIQNYFWSGVEKLKTGGKEIFSWIFENETSLLIVKSRLDGFLHQIDLDYFISATSFMHSLNVPLNFIVIFLELSICLVFYHKKFLSIYLISCSLLNLGIFLQTGIFFYEWLLLGILFSFIVLKREWGAISFAKTIGPLAFILILFGSTWHYPHKLGWVDYPILNMIEIYAQNKNGEIIIIDENSFDPYDRSFNYDENYLFFAKNKIISRYYFIYFFDMRYFFEVVHSPEEFVKFQNHMGHYFYDQKKIKKFDRFVKKYFASKRIKKSALLKWDVFRLPFHLYHTKESPLKENFEDIESVIVVYKQYLILKNKPILIIDKEVHRVKVQ